MYIPELNEEDIQNLFDNQSWQRGVNYFHNGAIFDARIRGNHIKAFCEGSMDQPYVVTVEFDLNEIKNSHCSCPVGSQGDCKHVAALLLTWVHKPKNFIEVEELETTFKKQSKEELISLIRQMINREPELESIVEVPVNGNSSSISVKNAERTESAIKVNMESYNRRIGNAFRCRHGWNAEEAIADELSVIIADGNNLAKNGDYNSAFAIYLAVIREIMEQFEIFEDQEGDLGAVVNECVEGLERCLAGIKDLSVRKEILNLLFKIIEFDIDMGGIDFGYKANDIILRHATSEEKEVMADLVRDSMKKTSSEWARKECGGFLMDLEKDKLDDKAFIQLCRESGRLNDLVDRLLALKRVEEATKVAEESSDYGILEIADIFEKHNHHSVAMGLIIKRAGKSDDRRLLEWLKKRYKKQGKLSEALHIAYKLFQMENSLDRYKDLRVLAKKLNIWIDMRSKILENLEADKDFALLTEIHLNEKEVSSAVETVTQLQPEPYGYFDYQLLVNVAKAAEKDQPLDAIELRKMIAERLINSRGRQNYISACVHLKCMHSLFKRLKKEEEWKSYINYLLERNTTLRALKEEVRNAGL